MATIKTLEVNITRVSDDYKNAIKNFIAAFHSSVENMVLTKELVVWKLDFHKYKPAEEELAYHYHYDSDLQVSFVLDWFHREVFWETNVVFNLPWIIGWEQVYLRNITSNVLLPLVRDWFFDDEFLMFIRPFLEILPIYYNKNTGAIWFSIDYYKSNHSKKSTKNIELSKIVTTWISNLDILSYEIEQWFINHKIGDPERGYAFTHKIRELLDMKFYYWQKEVVRLWAKINIVFAVRNSGKTAFACYVWLREIISEKKWFGIRKNRKVIYFVPDKVDIGEQIMDYMEWYIDAIFDSALQAQLQTYEYINANESWKEVLLEEYEKQIQKLKKSYFKIERSKYQIKCNITGNSLKVVSLQDVMWKSWKELGSSKGEGLACDVYIVEEAPRIPDAFWKSFWERAETESDYGYISGTLNRETPKNHWTYKLAIKWELGDPDISTHRIALPNNENLFHGLAPWDTEWRNKIIERERSKLLEEGIKNLYVRWYGIILDESKVFNVSWNIVAEKEIWKTTDFRVIAMDFGGDSDPVWFVVYNMNTQTIEKSERFKWINVYEQLEIVFKEKLKYKNCYTLWDGTWFWRLARSSDLDWVVEYYITFTSWPEWKYNKEKWYYSVDKSYMVDLTKQFFDKWMYKIFHEDEDLLEDIENFIKITNSWARVQQYEAKRGKKDDLVACLLMISVFIVKALWLLEKKELQDYWLNLETDQEEIYNLLVNNAPEANNFYNWMY